MPRPGRTLLPSTGSSERCRQPAAEREEGKREETTMTQGTMKGRRGLPGAGVAFAMVLLIGGSAQAYPMYDDALNPIGSGAGCVDCHNQFKGGSKGALQFMH